MATIPLEAAAAAMREAMRDTVKRYSLWYLLQGISDGGRRLSRPDLSL